MKTIMGNNRHRFQLLFVLLMLFVMGCGDRELDTVNSVGALRVYAKDPMHGLLRTRSFSTLVWKVNLLPREIAEEGGIALGASGAGTIHFVVNIAPGSAYRGGDVMTNGVASYETYADRMIQLNFRMGENVRLQVGSHELSPKLCHMENTYGLSDDRNLHIVFADPYLSTDLRQLPTMDLVITDWIFGTGISHYPFKSEHLQKIPVLTL